MWKPGTTPPPNSPAPPPPAERLENSLAARVFTPAQQDVARIGKSITIKGDITGSEPLHIEGRVEGAVRLAGAYLNLGPEASLQSNIEAREVVVRGSVVGNVQVSERIDIRTGGSVVGDVVAHSVSIEEGAYFKGSIDMRGQEQGQHAPLEVIRQPASA